MVTEGVGRELRRALDAMIEERELDDKIAVLEETLRRLGVKRGPGRPPAKFAPSRSAGPRAGNKKRKKAKWTPAMRKAAAERAKARWAKARKAGMSTLEPGSKKEQAKEAKKKAAQKKTRKKKAAGRKTRPGKRKAHGAAGVPKTVPNTAKKGPRKKITKSEFKKRADGTMMPSPSPAPVA